MARFEAGANRRIITYDSDDTGGAADLERFAAGIATAAQAQAEAGWHVVSSSVFPLRQMGTAGNIFFQSGGQFATQLAAVVVDGAE